MSTIGRRGNTGVGIEGTPGTTTTMQAFLPTLSVDLVERHTPIGDLSAKGIRDEQGANSVQGKKWGEGSVEVVLDAQEAPRWIHLVMGSYSSSSTNIYIHTFSRKANNQPLSATIYRDRDTDAILFPYSVVNNLEITFADDIAKMTADILSMSPIVEDTESPSYSDLELFTWRNAELEVNDAGSTTELKIREFTLNINNNAEAIYAPNSNDVDRIVSKDFTVGGSFVIDFESTTQRSAFTALTKQRLVITLTEGTHKLTFTMPQVRIDQNDIITPLDDISQETITFVAEFDGTETLVIVARNDTVASYFE